MAAKVKKPSIKPTTMRIPDALLKRCSRQARNQDRSRTWLIIRYIEQGLQRDEESAGALA